MKRSRTFTELMLERIEQAPDADALLLLPGSEERGRPKPVTYRGLHASACELAGWLQARGARGERVLLLHLSRRQFAVSFLACLYAGAVAVPVPPTGSGSHYEARVCGIVRDAAPCAAFTDADLAPDVSRILAGCGYGSVPCLAADAVPGLGDCRPVASAPETIAYLQYTSGSTGSPRGVMITHENLLANQDALCAALGTAPGDRVGGWLPFHHDMGLVGQLLHPLWLGGTSVLLSPEAFLKRPVRWLEAIDRHRVTVSGAPDFAYDLCVREVSDEQLGKLDLSGWECAVTGGEPVREQTVRAFTERFARAGFRAEAMTPCYGLAEATLLVSGRRAASPPSACTVDAGALEKHRVEAARAERPQRTLVACGTAAADTEVRIVDPESLRELPEGEAGEVWVRGPGVAPGYWRNHTETGRVFGAATAGGAGGHLRTGDLGAVLGGRLHITGRIDDMIVVNGRNLYPQDLEHRVQELHALFGAATAFPAPGLPDQGLAGPGLADRVVVVQELRTHRRYDLDLAALASDVERRLAEEFDVPMASVLLVRPGTIRRTTSGKVERSATRRLFLNGGIKPLHQQLDRAPSV